MDPELKKAAIEGNVDKLDRLLKVDPQILQKASSVHNEDSLLHIAARSGKVGFVKKIVTEMPSLATEIDQQRKIPLHLASLEGHVETVRELLKANLDDGVNQCLLNDHEGWNPLHWASKKGKTEVIEVLISACPDCLKEVTAKKETVLHIAVNNNQYNAVTLLAKRIRDHRFHTLFKSQDQEGKTAREYAEAMLQSQVTKLLKEGEEEGDKIRDELAAANRQSQLEEVRKKDEERGQNVKAEGRDTEASKKEKEESKKSQSRCLFCPCLGTTP